MLYLLTSGEYSDYAVDELVEMPRELTADDAAAFQAYWQDPERWDSYWAEFAEDGDVFKARHPEWKLGPPDSYVGLMLKRWMLEQGGRVVDFKEAQDGRFTARSD